MALFISALALMTAFLSPTARADVNAHSEHLWDRELIHFTNNNPYPVNGRYYFSYNSKCGEAYSTWQHYSSDIQGISLNANSPGLAVYVLPYCAETTQVANVVFEWVSSVRADSAPEAPKPKPQPQPQPQSGQKTPSSGSSQPDSSQPGYSPNYSPQGQIETQPSYTPPASPCNGPLGAWSARHTTALGRTVTVSLSNGVLAVRSEAGIWNETLQIRLSQIDTDGFMRAAPVSGVWNLSISSKNSAPVVTILDSKGIIQSNRTTALSIDLNDRQSQDAALAEIASLVSRCGGYSLNDLFKPAGKKSSPDALAIELDSSAQKRSGLPAESGYGFDKKDASAIRID